MADPNFSEKVVDFAIKSYPKLRDKFLYRLPSSSLYMLLYLIVFYI